MLVGYMWVSSDSDRQTTDLRRDALLSAGVYSRHLTNLAAGDTSVGSTPSLRDADLIVNVQHDRARPLVRTGQGLVIEDRAQAVTLHAELPAGLDQDQALANVRAGILRGLSVEFVAVRERMDGGTRVISEARLKDVALVDRPAPTTQATVEARQKAAQELSGAIPRPARVWGCHEVALEQ